MTEQTQPSAGPEPTATSETESASAVPQTPAEAPAETTERLAKADDGAATQADAAEAAAPAEPETTGQPTPPQSAEHPEPANEADSGPAEESPATDIKVRFADPHSPRRRPTNENTGGPIREYFPKGTDFNNIRPPPGPGRPGPAQPPPTRSLERTDPHRDTGHHHQRCNHPLTPPWFALSRAKCTSRRPGRSGVGRRGPRDRRVTAEHVT